MILYDTFIKLINLLDSNKDEKIIDKENFVTTPQLYRIYRRSNRKDAVVLVNTSDLKIVSFLILDKLKLEDKYKKMKNLKNLL